MEKRHIATQIQGGYLGPPTAPFPAGVPERDLRSTTESPISDLDCL